MASNT